MTNIVYVDFAKRTKGLYSDKLALHFPPLYRILSSATADELQAIGMMDVSPFSECVDYTINDNIDVFGEYRRDIVRGVDANFPRSLVIRHHAGKHSALDYLHGAEDGGARANDIVVQTDEGFFTLIEIPTRSSFGGPMVFYGGWYETNNIIGQDYWEIAIDHNGEEKVNTSLASYEDD
ncbi:hypothetical protein ACXHXG_30605 [Rhizobium sp. LEGMi198b]